MMSTSRILITGGAGFVGSQLGAYLARQGHDVLLLDSMRYGHLDNLLEDGRPFARFVGRDIRDPSIGKLFQGIDVVFHLAGIAALPECEVNPANTYDVHVSGTASVLRWSRVAGVRRVIFSSTAAVYENTHNELQAESDPVAPDLVYSATKYAAEQLCRTVAHNYGLDIIVCRFFNVYGPHQDFLRVAPPFTSYVARELALGKRPILFNQSHEAKRDYVFVNDLADVLERMVHDTRFFSGEIFNIGSGTSYSVPEIYEILRAAAGSTIEPEFRDPSVFWDAYPQLFEGPKPLSRERVRKEVYKSSRANPEKTAQTFGWRAATTLHEGLRSVYEYTASQLVALGVDSQKAHSPRG